MNEFVEAFRVQVRNAGRFLFRHRLKYAINVVGDERTLKGGQLEHDAADRPDVTLRTIILIVDHYIYQCIHIQNNKQIEYMSL